MAIFRLYTRRRRWVEELYLDMVGAKGRRDAHETRLEQLAQMEKRIANLRNTIARTRREMVGLGKPDTQYAQVRASWIRAKAERARLVSGIARSSLPGRKARYARAFASERASMRFCRSFERPSQVQAFVAKRSTRSESW